MTRILQSMLIALIVGSTAGTALAKTDKLNTTITHVYANHGELLLKTAAGQGGEGCSNENWAEIPRDADNREFMFKIALSAYLSGRTVQVTLDGCDGYPQVSRIWLK